RFRSRREGNPGGHCQNQRRGRGQDRLDQSLEPEISHPSHLSRYGGNGKVRGGTAALAGRFASPLWVWRSGRVPGAKGYFGRHLGRKKQGATCLPPKLVGAKA